MQQNWWAINMTLVVAYFLGHPVYKRNDFNYPHRHFLSWQRSTSVRGSGVQLAAGNDRPRSESVPPISALTNHRSRGRVSPNRQVGSATKRAVGSAKVRFGRFCMWMKHERSRFVCGAVNHTQLSTLASHTPSALLFITHTHTHTYTASYAMGQINRPWNSWLNEIRHPTKTVRITKWNWNKAV